LFYDSSMSFESYTRVGDETPDSGQTAATSLALEVRQIIRELSPSGMMIGEQGNPFTAQSIDMWMEWYRDFETAMRATYSMPQTMRSWVVDNNVADATRAFACGMQLCLTPCGSEGTLDDVPELAAQVAKMAKLRAAAGDRFCYSRFRHTRGIDMEMDGDLI